VSVEKRDSAPQGMGTFVFESHDYLIRNLTTRQ
jgi:hypothetical protein